MKKYFSGGSLLISNISSLNKIDKYLKNLLIIIFGSILLAISARIKIDIPPVPVTMQTLVLLVFAMSVGWKLSVTTFLVYLVEGSFGLPVFANPPFGGAGYLMGPSGGYLLGMLIASWLVGYLAENNYDKNYFKSLIAIFLGTIVIFIPGLIWLAYWFNFLSSNALELNISQSISLALEFGLLKFVYTEPIKVSLDATVTPLILKYIKK